MRYEGDCAFCREPVIGGQVAYRVTGWEFAPFGGGKSSTVHGRKRVRGEVAHIVCVDLALRRQRDGIHDEQTALL